MAKNKETRIDELERKWNVEEDVLVTHWEHEDFVTFCLPLSMRGVRMPVEEYKAKYANGTEVVISYTEDWNKLHISH